MNHIIELTCSNIGFTDKVTINIPLIVTVQQYLLPLQEEDLLIPVQVPARCEPAYIKRISNVSA